MYKEKIIKLKNDLLSMNTLAQLKIKEITTEQITTVPHTEVKKNYFFLIPSIVSATLFLVTENNYVKYGGLSLNLLSLYLYAKNQKKEIKTEEKIAIPKYNTDFFPDKMFVIYDTISDKWNNDIKLISEEMVNYYTNENMEVIEELDIKSKIYNFQFFTNEKSTVLSEFYSLRKDENYVVNYNNLITNAYNKLNVQIEKICTEQIALYANIKST